MREIKSRSCFDSTMDYLEHCNSVLMSNQITLMRELDALARKNGQLQATINIMNSGSNKEMRISSLIRNFESAIMEILK